MLTLEKVKVLVLGYLDIDNYIDPIQQTLTFHRSDGSYIVIRVGAKSSQFTVYPKDIDNNIPISRTEITTLDDLYDCMVEYAV